jgi:hypothetical protein
MKKAQGISMNVIIIAAIALLVLVVIVAIFSGRMGVFNKNLNDNSKNTCEAPYGACKAACDTGEVQVFGRTCTDTTKPMCCNKVQTT